MLARIRPVVSRPIVVHPGRSPPAIPRPAGGSIAAVACLVVLTAACSSAPTPAVKVPEGRQFIPMVPDSIDDVGLAPSVAVDGEGLPNISYFGFAAQLEEGDIPVARPVGSPFLQTEEGEDAGAVLLASLTPEQIWNRGAVAQPRESPGGVPVPSSRRPNRPSPASHRRGRRAPTSPSAARTSTRRGRPTPASGTAWARRSRSRRSRTTPEAGAPSIVGERLRRPDRRLHRGGGSAGGASGGTGGGAVAGHARGDPLRVR